MTTPATSTVISQDSTSSVSPETHCAVSVIIPTYKEAENLPVLVPQISAALEPLGLEFEILVVDDNSPDETPAVCEKLAETYPVHLLVRTTDRGLSPAVVHGLNHARGDVFIVMDADLSHPPERLPDLIAALVDKHGDFVIGSRYVPGGTTDDDWSFFRWVNSKVATVLSRGLTSSRDPMAGFFGLTRKTYEQAAELNPIGYKIGLELIVKCGCKKVCEVPIHFRDRLHGESKLSFKEQVNYLRHLYRLYQFQYRNLMTPMMFGLVGLSGIVIDLVLLTLLMVSMSYPVARGLAILGAMSWNFLGNRYLTFSDRRQESMGWQYLKFCGSCSLGAVVSWGVSNGLWNYAPTMVQSPIVAALAGIASGFVLNYVLSNHFAFRTTDEKKKLVTDDAPASAPQQHTQDALLSETSQAAPLNSTRSLILGSITSIILAFVVCLPSLNRSEIDGLDQAHNILTSIFFYDAWHDLPADHLVGYTFDYQRQYPALGLTFWPPLFHSITGTLMLVTGPEITTVRLSMAAFTALFFVAAFLIVAQSASMWWGLLAVGLIASSSLVFDLSNSAMLEIPSLAMAMLMVWYYRRVTLRGHWANTYEAIGAGLLAAAIAYTKQPAIFVLFAIVLDLLVSQRKFFVAPRTWIAAAVAVVSIIPLVLFTLKFGGVNIAQSVGSQGNIYVDHHRVADRWSWEGWTYYSQLLTAETSFLLIGLALMGAASVWMSRERLRNQGLIFWCLLCWYGLFSYFDNKQIRFAVYAIPFLVMLATFFVAWLETRRQWLGRLAIIPLFFVLVQQTNLTANTPVQGYKQLPKLINTCLDRSESGNMAYFGNDHHLFTTQLRIEDSHRNHYLVRGDDLLEASDQHLQTGLHDFQIRWLIVDPELEDGQKTLAAIKADPESFEQLTEVIQLDNSRKPFQVQIFEFKGELAPEMKDIPLRSKVQGISEDDTL